MFSLLISKLLTVAFLSSWSDIYPVHNNRKYSIFLYLGHVKRKGVIEHAQDDPDSLSSHACAQSHLGNCSPLIHSISQMILLADSGSPDQTARCPHMPEDRFSHGTAHLKSKNYYQRFSYLWWIFLRLYLGIKGWSLVVLNITQSAFYVNLYRAVIGPSG